ncbi:hypothetical protein KCU93_g10253, partial [Aureobasidium melanogenum]
MSHPIVLQALNYYDALVVRAANANSPEEADALMRQAMTQRSEAVTGMPEVRIIDPRFHRSMQAMLATLDQDFDSSSESSDGEDDEEKEDEEDEEEGDNEGNEEPVVPVRPHVRRYPEPALVEIGIAMSLAPFESAGPKWTKQSRRTQQYLGAWRAAVNGPFTRDDMFPAFTKQMVICLKAEATESVSQVFNLIEHVGLANKLNNVLSTMSNRHGNNYQTYLIWRQQQGRRGGSRGFYDSIRKFIIHQAVSTLFGREPASSVANLKLVNSLVRRAEVLHALELAFGPGVFVLLLGFMEAPRRPGTKEQRLS